MQPQPAPTNYRKIRRNQERTLLLLVVAALIVIGPALIGLIWGIQAALFGFVCLLGGAVLIGGLWFLLGLVQKWVGE